MSDDVFPSLNSVSLIGTVHEEPQIVVAGRSRSVTLAVRTRHDGEERLHRVVIQDEFLAKAVHPRLVAGAVIHVLGEIDYDDAGALVAVTNRRGSDVHVLGDAEERAEPRPEAVPVRASASQSLRPAPVTPPSAPRVPPAPAPSPAAAPRPEVPEAPVEAERAEDETDAGHADAGGDDIPEAESPAAAPVRPVTPMAPVRPPVALPARPAAGGLRGGLSGLSASSAPTGDGHEETQEAGSEPVAEEAPAAPARAAVMVPRPAPMLNGRPMPPRAPTATPIPPRPAPPPGPRPPMPTGRPQAPVYPARKALGPAADDDDIPFAAAMPAEFAAYDGHPITGCGIVPRGFPHD